MFQLDPQLASDTQLLGDFPLCRVLLGKDANYPWCILVPRRDNVTEIYQLAEQDQRQLLAESSHLAQTLRHIFNGHKMNVAALGNVVAQLHLHHIVRYRDDVAWPGPVWGQFPGRAYCAEMLQERIDIICDGLAGGFKRIL